MKRPIIEIISPSISVNGNFLPCYLSHICIGRSRNGIRWKVQLLNSINFISAIHTTILHITLTIFLEIQTFAGQDCRLYKIIYFERRLTYWPRVARITLHCKRETFCVLLAVWKEPLRRQNIRNGGSFDKLLQCLTSQEQNMKYNDKHMSTHLQ